MEQVTFIAPAFNEVKHNRVILESLLNQYNSNWKLFIYHNGPNEEMKQWVESYKDKRIEYLQSNENTGYWGCYNRIDVLKNYLDTKYVVQTSIQDYFTSNAVGTILEKMEEKNADISYWDSLYYPKYHLFISELKSCYIDWGNFCLLSTVAKQLLIPEPTAHTADGITIETGLIRKMFNNIVKIDSVLTIKN